LQYIPVTEQRRDELPGTALDAFESAVRYGPMFPCVCCHGLFYRHGVAEAEGVQGIRRGSAGQKHFLDVPYITSHLAMFTRLGRQWCCTLCMVAVDAGRLPALAARNQLEATWTSLPPALLTLRPEELELCGLNHSLGHIHGLQQGVAGVGGPTKTIHYLMPNTKYVTKLVDYTKPPETVMSLHTWPPGELPLLEPSLVLEAWDRLLCRHPCYRASPTVQKSMKDYLTTMLAEVPHREVETEQLAGEPDGTKLDHFTATGPRLARLDGIILPWAKLHLPLAFRQLVDLNGLEAQFGAIYDEKQEAGTERRRRVGSDGEVEGEGEERQVALTLQQWLQQRLSNVHRTGPASQPWLFLALVAAVDAKRLAMISQTVYHSRPMIEHPGSQDFYDKDLRHSFSPFR
jgi:hypothetical protein